MGTFYYFFEEKSLSILQGMLKNLKEFLFVCFDFQEQSFWCRGGLAWWRDFLIVPCYNSNSSTDEVGDRVNHSDIHFIN